MLITTPIKLIRFIVFIQYMAVFEYCTMILKLYLQNKKKLLYNFMRNYDNK